MYDYYFLMIMLAHKSDYIAHLPKITVGVTWKKMEAIWGGEIRF